MLLHALVALAAPDCDVRLTEAKHVERHACSGSVFAADVGDIGFLELERGPVEPRQLVVEIAAWRLESVTVSIDGTPLCIPELEPCADPVGHGLLLMESLPMPPGALVPPERWTWVLTLDWPPDAKAVRVGWIDAWR